MPASLFRDPWLLAVVVSRALLTMIFMTYAACMPVLIEAWDMSATQAGSIAGGFHFGYLISLVVFSWAADRIGALRVFLLSAALSAVSALAFALLARSYETGLALFTLVALTQGGTYYPAIMLISDRYPPERRGSAMGWLIASTSLGYALSLMVSAQMLTLGGYRLAFLVTAGGTAVGSAVALAALRRTPNVIHSHQREHSFRSELARNRPAIRLMTGYTFHSWELLGMWAWMPAFLAAGLVAGGAVSITAVATGASLAAGFHLVGFVASSTMGRLSDRIGRRMVLLGLAAASTVCSLAIGWMIGWPTTVVVVVGAIYAYTAVGDSPVLSTALTEAVRPGYLGATLALRGVLGFGAGAIAAPVFGMVLDATNPAAAATPTVWGWAFAVLGGGGLIATIAAYGVRRGTPASETA